jgi:hypothetical protein
LYKEVKNLFSLFQGLYDFLLATQSHCKAEMLIAASNTPKKLNKEKKIIRKKKKFTWSKFETLSHIIGIHVAISSSFLGYIEHIFGNIQSYPSVILFREFLAT